MISLVAALKVTGGIDLLEAPWYLVNAINAGNNVLGLMELTEDYRPPEEIWHHQDRLKEWFDSLSHKNSSNSYADIPHDPRIDNSAAADYRRRIGAPPA